MKKLFLLFLSFHMVFQASSIIHKAIPYIGNSGSKAATIHAASGIKNVDLSKLASEYWNHLKTKEVDYYLYSLITDETLKNGNKRFGLTAEDVQQIKNFLLQFTMFNHTEYFAFSVLPKWLQEIYENKQNELIEKINITDKDSEFNFLKEKKVHLGLFVYVLQNYYQQQLGHKRYWYVKKTWKMTPEAIDFKVKDLEAVIKTVEHKYVYIKNLETIEDEDWSYDHVIILEEDLIDQKIIDILKKVLKDRPDVTVIIAVDDDQLVIDDEFYIRSDLAIKNLVITSRSLIEIGDSFLFGYRSLKKLYLPDGLTEVGNAFLNDSRGLVSLSLPDELNVVKPAFLGGCISLTSLQLPNGLTKVGSFFLSHCTGLVSLNLPDGLAQVDNDFLKRCTNLTSLNLPDGLTTVGNNFLGECMSLTSLELPYGLTLVGWGFLYSCIELKQLKITNTLYKKLKIDNKLRSIPTDTRIIFY